MSAPPGALLLVMAYGAGLLTGLLHFLDPAIAVPLLLVAVWSLRRSAHALVAATIAVGMLVGARVRESSRESCAARLPLGDQPYRVRTVDPGAALARVVVLGRTCQGIVSAHWSGPLTIGAGHVVEVRGRWRPQIGALGRPGGTLVLGPAGRVSGTPSWIDSARTVLARASVALYGPRAAMVDAVVMGRRGALDRELVAQFAAAGLVHLLAISGLHIGVIAGWILLLAQRLPLGRHQREALAAAAAIGYTLFIGSPPSAERAAALMMLLAFCRWRQRNVGPLALLAASAFIVLCVDPFALGAIGAWLSVLALGGVTAATRWSDRAIGTRPIVRALSGSVGATLATAPLTALVFGQVAPIGVLLNLVAVPITALAVPVLLISLLSWTTLPTLAAAFATSGAWLLDALRVVAHFGAAAPGAAPGGVAGLPAALPWVAAAGTALWVVAGRTTAREALRRVGWGSTTILWVLLALSHRGPEPLGDGRLALLFVDVGQGDAALVRTPAGRWLAVDAGPVDRQGRDAGSRVLLPLLARQGVTQLAGVILSHAHRDHVGGASALVRRLRVGAALEPGELFGDSAYDGWLSVLAERGVRWHPVRAGSAWQIDGVEFRVLHPPARWPRQGDDLNEDSVVLELRYGQFTALLMGDAGFVAESAMAGSLPAADVLKVGHHGSRWASGEAFLAAVHPQVGVISVGQNNYGHPAPTTLERLSRAGVRVWRTDREGTTTVLTDGVSFEVHGGRTSATFAARARTGPRR